MMSATATPDGVLLVDKAAGMTSHDVVALVRRQLQIKKVGHCGTLDPIATGLLILTLGRGTKIQDLLMSEDKEYVGTLSLGKSTDTQDRAGEVTEERPVPELTEENVRAAFRQIPRRFLSDAADGFGDQAGRRSALQTGATGKDGRARAAPRACLPLQHRSYRLAGNRFYGLVQQRILCSHLCPRHRRESRLRSAFAGAAAHALRSL